jgi:hypothetical protein
VGWRVVIAGNVDGRFWNIHRQTSSESVPGNVVITGRTGVRSNDPPEDIAESGIQFHSK